MNISEHITYDEAVKSQTATRLKIENIPSGEQVECMKIVAEKCFEPMRTYWGTSLMVDSFYRSPELNKAIGGVVTSQHCKGEAIDVYAGSLANNKKLLEWAKANLIFDQLLWEFGTDEGPSWVHISFTAKKKNRQEYLRVK